MSKVASFWDASALVPLCVHETTSRQAQSHLRKSLPVVWWGSVVEVHSAVMRLHHSGKLSGIETRGALARLGLLNKGWREVLPTDQVRDLANQNIGFVRTAGCGQLATRRGHDLVSTEPRKRGFVCADQRLSRAADAAGFAAVELSHVP